MYAAHVVPTEQISTEQLPTKQSPCSYPRGSIPCKVWNYTNLDCSWRKLDCVPPLPHAASLKFIDLSCNIISHISEGAFSNVKVIQSLDMRFNKIQFIPDDTFSNLRQLQSLNLFFNKISVVQLKTFSGLQELQYLGLFGNRISHIHDGAFSELSKLLNLVLSLNSLSVLRNDTFTGLYKLEQLHLFLNNISVINSNAFSRLSKLKYLDLSLNKLEILDGSPLYGLISLQTLVMLGDRYTINLDFVTAPFARLISLHRLNIALNIESVSDCAKVEKLFNGLNKLEYLSLRVNGQLCSHFEICSLASLKSLELMNVNVNNTNKCLKKIPLKVLNFTPPNKKPIYPPYSLLPHLTNLSIDIKADVPKTIKAMQSLNSPLQELIINFSTNLTLNATTFEPCAKWNESLVVLVLHCQGECTKVLIDTPSFNWFSNLRSLLLSGGYDSTILFHKDTFKGLNNLQELHLIGYFKSGNVFSSGALQTFSRYNTLKVLDFSTDQMSGGISGDQLCTISSSLETLVLSHNHFDSFPEDLPCTLPDLKVLVIKEQYSKTMWDFTGTCQAAPNLIEFNASNIDKVNTIACTVDTCRCPSLKSLDASGNWFSYSKFEVYAPCLETLLLNSITTSTSNVMDVPQSFRSHQLKYLSFSGNKLSFISEQDAAFFHNLTFLDLSDNLLTSINSLLYFRNLQKLYLHNNQIGTVPKSILSKSKLPYLQEFNLSQNQLVCDCSIEPLAKWLQTDKVVYLQSYRKGYDGNYCCAFPESRRGQSITEINLDCESHMWLYISIGITCFVVLVVTASLAVWYRWHIQYQLFLLFNRRRNYQNYLVNDDNADQDDDEGGPPRYDAYVTYHREDEDWVDEELVANIEEGEEPFRLCLRTRDIRAGRLIFNELSLSIQRSRKILVILSPRFVEDNWCYFELNMAQHRVLEENRNVMIFIILEEIPNNKLTLLLRQLFCRVQVIKWPADGYGQNLFWRRLREELKRPVPLDRRFNL